MDQPLRRIQDEGGYKKIQDLIDKMKNILGKEEDDDEAEDGATVKTKAAALQLPMPPFTVKLDDPAGNSFIEFIGGMNDPKWNLRTYHRTLDQNIALGLVSPDDEAAKMSSMKQVMMSANADTARTDDPITDDEVFVFPGSCSSCGHQIHTNMKKVNIPYFKVSSALRLIAEFWLLLLGYIDHVNELWILRVQRQWSQIGVCYISSREENHSQVWRPWRSEPWYPEGVYLSVLDSVFLSFFTACHLERDGGFDNPRNRPRPHPWNARRSVHHGGRYFGTDLWRTSRESIRRRLVWDGWKGEIREFSIWSEGGAFPIQISFNALTHRLGQFFIGQKCRTTIHNHSRWSIGEFIHPESLRSRPGPKHDDRILRAKFRAERGVRAKWYQSGGIWRRCRESDRGKGSLKNVESDMDAVPP